MKIKNKDTSAFPGKSEHGFKEYVNETGLTKREWFAGMALQGFLANKWSIEGNYSTEQRAEMAIQLADEILKQLEKL